MKFASLILVAAPFLVLLSGVAADTPWEFTLPSHSPAISYLPYGDGRDPALGWSIWTSKLGLGDPKQTGITANGDIFRISSLHGASLTLSFYGTGITMFGSSNATYNVQLDNAAVHIGTQDGILASLSGLQLREHFLTLTVGTVPRDGGRLSFSHAVISSISPEPVKSSSVAFDAPEVKLDGVWEQKSIPEVSRYVSTNVFLANATLTFANARAVAVHGLITFGHFLYGIELDGQQMFPPAASATASSVFNASTLWLVPDTVLFYKDGLDAGDGKEHTLQVTNLGANPEWYAFTLTSFEVWQVGDGETASATTTTTGTSTASQTSSQTVEVQSVVADNQSLSSGAIAGVVIAIVASLLVVAGALLFCIRRRRASLAASSQSMANYAAPYPVSIAPSAATVSSGWPPSGSEVSPFVATGPFATRDAKQGRFDPYAVSPGVPSESHAPSGTSGSAYTPTVNNIQPRAIPVGEDAPPPSYQVR